MNLQQRVHERINSLNERHPGVFDLTVTGYSVKASRRGTGSTKSLYVFTADPKGIGFELELLPGDDPKSLFATFAAVQRGLHA